MVVDVKSSTTFGDNGTRLVRRRDVKTPDLLGFGDLSAWPLG
jgi:hypothetical protein